MICPECQTEMQCIDSEESLYVCPKCEPSLIQDSTPYPDETLDEY
jgi:Zn-finger nucleic acid-binding protein